MEADTYFFNADEALRVASLQNRNEDASLLQVCYYSGEKIDSQYQNLIHIPIESLVEDLARGIYRIPTVLDFKYFDVSDEVRKEIDKNFGVSLVEARKYRTQLKAHYFELLKNAKPDFSETLRFYIPANHTSRVMQHISKNVANALESLGYEVLYDLNIGISDPNVVKKAAQFNPHAIFNINHLNNSMISDEVFNFVWVQDHFALEQFEGIKIREKDIVYHLVQSVGGYLKSIKIISQYQAFCIDTDIYKSRKSINRENKIVMIGGSYKNDFDLVKHSKKDEIAEILLNDYVLGTHTISTELGKYFISLRERFNIAADELGKIVKYVERDGFLSYISGLDMEYQLELYGWGWDETPEYKNNYKGILSYGEDISKVYNSAKYTLVLGGYALQQRTLESAASGCIPLVYDSRHNASGSEDEKCFKESLIFFRKPDEIQFLLDKEHKLDLNCIVESNSYISFVKKMIKTIEDSNLS